jgi:CRP-like cAMP-binding protein
MDGGDATKVGLVGWEGVVGLPVLLSEPADDLEAMTQCQGTALSLSSDAFRSAMEDDPALRHLMLRMPCCT